MKPKVLHVTQSTGGVETSLLLLFRHLDRERFEYHLACPPGTTLAEEARKLGVTTHPVAMVRSANPVRDIAGLLALTRLIRDGRPAIVHGHSAKGGYLARLAARRAGTGSRTVYAPRAFSYLSQRGLARRVFLAMERQAVPWTDRLIACSGSEAERAVREVGFPRERVLTIENSIDDGEIAAAVAEAGPRSAPPVVLTVGRLTWQKNPEMFVRMAARVRRVSPEVRFVMLGAGFASPLEDATRQLAVRLGVDDALRIEPWTEKRAALRAMAEASVFVLTSRFEGMPNTLLEALAVGTPAVVTDADGSRDVLAGGGAGALVPQDDDAAMADAVLGLLRDPSGAAAAGAAGREAARRRFDVRSNAAVLIKEYARLMGMPER